VPDLESDSEKTDHLSPARGQNRRSRQKAFPPRRPQRLTKHARSMPTLSVVIPCYNERPTIRRIVDAVRASGVASLEIIVIDDCSTDGTRDVLKTEIEPLVSKIVYHEKNQGKGAALRSGFAHATGDYVIVQDADLEYDPREFPALMEPLLAGKADVVFGSRFAGGHAHRVLYFWHSVGNKFLTILSNMATNLNLTDMECCYKMFKREVVQGLQLKEDRFGFEPEITAKVARLGVRIYEVGVSYSGRTYAEGKKIGWRDGFRALYAIAKYNLLSR
jgi:glycosyltransferase involved in cell wall biosynthesis